MPETTIDFEHLMRDIVQAYPFNLAEAVLVELVANALDAGSSTIAIETRGHTGVFSVTDDGLGMTRDEFVHYHDLAVTAKQRGRGIGFAGLGAKLGVYLAKEVVTETRSAATWTASRWYARGRRPPWWDEIDQRTLERTGTRVTLRPPEGSPLLDDAEVRRLLLLHYGPLLDPHLSAIYQKAKVYPRGITFSINGSPLNHEPVVPQEAQENRYDFSLASGKRRQPVGIGYFVLSREPVPEDLQGIAMCTYGKVIKRDWFRKYPRDAARITGFVEIPRLVEVLNTTKSDFLRTGAEGQKYYQFYREMQRELGKWLESLGEISERPAAAREAEKLERLVRQILAEIPEFQGFFGARTRQDVSIPSSDGDPAVKKESGIQRVAGIEGGAEPSDGVPVAPGPDAGESFDPSPGGDHRALPARRTLRTGPHVVWIDGGGDRGLGWVDADNVVINTGHPAFKKANAHGFKSYHDLIGIAFALLDHRATDDANAVDLLNRFLAGWGRL